MATITIVCICLLLPLTCFLLIKKKHQVSWGMLVLGMITFFVTQMILRIPLLNYFQGNAQFYVFMLNTVPYLLLLSITASLFEESGRWIAMKYIKKPSGFYDALTFGIGHGMIEAILLVMIPMLMQSMLTLDMVIVASLERLMAMIFHICASLFIYKGIKEKRLSFIITAYVAHAYFNFIPIYFGNYVMSNVMITEGCIAVCTLMMLWLTYQFIYKKESV